MKRAALPAALAVTAMLSGCVAVAVPIAASGVIGKRQLDRRRAAKATLKALDRSEPAATKVTLLPPGTALPPPSNAPAATNTVAEPAGWRALLRYVAHALVEGDPECAGRLPAVMIDADVAAAPQADRDTAITAINAFGTMDVTVVYIGEPDRAAGLSAAGFGTPAIGQTLVRSTDAPGIAARYCVAATGATRADEGWPAALPAVKTFRLPGSDAAPAAPGD